jgi:hypothetical protein
LSILPRAPSHLVPVAFKHHHPSLEAQAKKISSLPWHAINARSYKTAASPLHTAKKIIFDSSCTSLPPFPLDPAFGRCTYSYSLLDLRLITQASCFLLDRKIHPSLIHHAPSTGSSSRRIPSIAARHLSTKERQHTRHRSRQIYRAVADAVATTLSQSNTNFNRIDNNKLLPRPVSILP